MMRVQREGEGIKSSRQGMWGSLVSEMLRVYSEYERFADLVNPLFQSERVR